MRRGAFVLLALLAFPLLNAAARPTDGQLIARPFPIEAAPTFPGGLFHWVDSLAGTSGGKTIPAHREQYLELFGDLDDEDVRHLTAFTSLRRARPSSAMLGVFCAAASVDDALSVIQDELSPQAWAELAAALAHFRPKYERIWNEGSIPTSFLVRARRDSSRSRLQGLLKKLVRFYRVDPRGSPPPRLALVPVPPGHGTHAEAIGRVLLLEIRPDDDLADEASVIVHETSHFLWGLVPEERRQQLGAFATSRGDAAARTMALLREAIPTALGQGAADRMFHPESWSIDGPWYHTRDVDLCAKRIYPLVQKALKAGSALDESFLSEVFRLEPGKSAAVVTPGPRTYIPSRFGETSP